MRGLRSLLPAFLLLAALTAAPLVRPATACAMTIYGYQDPSGTIHLSDIPLSRHYKVLYSYTASKPPRYGFEDIRRIIREKGAAMSPGQSGKGRLSAADFMTAVRRANGRALDRPPAPGRKLSAEEFFAHLRRGGPPLMYAVRDFSRRLGVRTPSPDIRDKIEAVSRAYGLDPDLVYAVVEAESGFDVAAVSPKGARGLMQIMPSTGRELGLLNPFDPDDNLDAGARYLKAMLDSFGRTDFALAAYNAGPGAVQRYGGVPPYQETAQYVSRILNRYAGMKRSKATDNGADRR